MRHELQLLKNQLGHQNLYENKQEQLLNINSPSKHFASTNILISGATIKILDKTRGGNFNENRNILLIPLIRRANTRKLYQQLLSAPQHVIVRRKQFICNRQGVFELATRSSQHLGEWTSSANSARKRSSDLLKFFKYLSFTRTYKHLFFKPHQVFLVGVQPRGSWFLIQPQYLYLKFEYTFSSQLQFHILF